MIKERICSYELSKLLQEKGFDEECDNWYVDEDLDIIHVNDCIGSQSNSDHYADDFECSAPTHQMAMDWLRIVHGIYIIILPSRMKENSFLFQIIHSPCSRYDTWEDLRNYSDFGRTVEAACTYALSFL